MFQVTISYIERDLTMAEASALARAKFGDNAIISFAPTTNSEEAVMDFMLECAVTQKQAAAKFSNHKELYSEKVECIKKDILTKITNRLDNLIKQNEERL